MRYSYSPSKLSILPYILSIRLAGGGWLRERTHEKLTGKTGGPKRIDVSVDELQLVLIINPVDDVPSHVEEVVADDAESNGASTSSPL
jgi:hypothetical protein